MDRKRVVRSWWLWGLLILIGLFVLPSLVSTGDSYHSIDTSKALSQVDSGNVTKAVIHDKEQVLELDLKNAVDGHTKVKTSYPADATQQIFGEIKSHVSGSNTFTTKVSKDNPWLSLLFSMLPFLLLFGILFFILSQMQGGGNRVMSFGRSKAKLVNKDMPKTTFADVAGVDEAIEELQEIKEFLENPAKFQAIGAKIP
ncbi:MAG TPA: ATP-dependent metallopeptidase FtsH/Yme1/Tma family protein, partial [Jatrophihabitantaceae bacterium]|nr:ATP-dependent metallopeptidase FtsH/Yme1/Tma family protein [Jatrophihabitantaceae bacterium]